MRWLVRSGRVPRSTRSRWLRGGRVASILAVLTLLLSGCSASDWERDLRFGFPTGVTKQATRIRVLWTWAGVTALAIGIIVWALIFWCIIRYRKKDDALPRQTKYNFAVEMTCVIIPFIVVAGLFWRTVVVEDDVDTLTAHPDVYVQVDAFKWNWEFEYHSYKNPDGQYVQTDYTGVKNYGDSSGTADDQAAPTVRVCDEASSNNSYNCGASTDSNTGSTSNNPLYLSTVGSSDEIPVLVIPVNKTVRFDEHSEDVIHSFWVPEFLFKRDVIPYGTSSTSRDNQFEITPTKVGSYVGRCAELCGTYHSQMNFEVRVVPDSTFLKYLAALKKLGPYDPSRQSQALAAAGMAPYATTTYPFYTDPTARSASQPGEQEGS